MTPLQNYSKDVFPVGSISETERKMMVDRQQQEFMQASGGSPKNNFHYNEFGGRHSSVQNSLKNAG